MPLKPLPFDLTHDERNEIQLVSCELDLHPERRMTMLAELVLLRQLSAWAMEHRHYFPPALRAKLLTLGNRTAIRQLVADGREEIDA